MDNVTHTLAGLALARTGLARCTSGAIPALVLSSNIPDVDLLFGLQGTVSYLHHHRGLTHSIVGAPVLAAALAGVLRLAVKGSRFLSLLLCALAGVAGHVFMDLWTSYGTRVLEPFDRNWYAWDLVFIVDPVVILLLLASILPLPRGSLGPRVAAAGLGLVLAYVGGRAVLHARALYEALARVPSGTVLRAAAIPSFLDPLTWRVLADTGGAYWTGEIRLDGPSAPLTRRDKLRETDAVVRAREGSTVASTFLDFSRFPWLEVDEKPEGTVVEWRDLRYDLPNRRSFVTRVVVARDGRIRSEAFRF